MLGLRAGGEGCGEAMDVLHHIDHQRLRVVAYRQCMAGIRREVDPYPPRDVLREHQLTVVLLGQPLETAGDVGERLNTRRSTDFSVVLFRVA